MIMLILEQLTNASLLSGYTESSSTPPRRKSCLSPGDDVWIPMKASRSAVAPANVTNDQWHRRRTERIQIGYFKGNVVAIKRIFKKHVDLTRSILKELNTVSLHCLQLSATLVAIFDFFFIIWC
jgi:hypothetical protein